MVHRRDPRPVKISIVLGPFQPVPPEGHGAVEKVWFELAQAFARSGHAVRLIGKGDVPAVPGGQAQGVHVVQVRGFAATGRLWLDLAKDLVYALAMRRHIEPCDVIVTNTFWMPVVLRWLGPRRGKVVVHVARFPKGQMGLYADAGALQAISSSVAQEIVRQCPAVKDKVRVLPYPIDLQVYRPPESRRRYDGELVLLYVGRIHPEKGVGLLLAAFRRVLQLVPQARLRLVGPVAVEQGGGGAAYLESLRTAAGGLPVEFVGAIRDPVLLADEYRGAHCFCYPSLAEKGEALGLAVLEAMATALPVVVSDLACFRDFVTHDVDGVTFDHRAPAPEVALAEALGRILSNPGLAARLGQGASARAQDFELEKVARRYVALFEDVALERRIGYISRPDA